MGLDYNRHSSAVTLCSANMDVRGARTRSRAAPCPVGLAKHLPRHPGRPNINRL